MLLSDPKETPSLQIGVVRQKPTFLRNVCNRFPSIRRSPYSSRRDKWLAVLPISTRTPMLAPGSHSITSTCSTLQRPCWLSSSHLFPHLNFSSSWASLPPATHSPYNPVSAVLALFVFLFCPRSLFVLSLTHHPRLLSLFCSSFSHGQVDSAGHVQSTTSSLSSGLFEIPLAVFSLSLSLSCLQ